MGVHSSRNAFVALFALLLGLSGCASGGGSSSGGGLDVDDLMAQASDVERGEDPRNTDNTRAADDHLDAAEDADDPAQARQHYQAALTSAQAAIAEDARNPLAYRLAALANLGLGNYQAAGENFDRSEELRPLYQFENVAVRENAYIDEYQAASQFLGTGDYDQAAVHLENAAGVYGGRPEANITLAQIYASQRNHDAAIEKIDAVESFLNSDAVAEVDEEMVAGWREQVASFPLLRAQILADAGRYEEAVVAYRALAAENPGDMALQQDLAGILMEMGETEQALVVYRQLAAQPGLNSDELSRIGLGFYQGDAYAEAAAALERAAEVSPMDRDAIEWWARSLLADSAYAEIPPVTQRWLELDPQSQQGLAIMAQAANMAGNTQMAAETVGRLQNLEFSVDNLQMRRYLDGGAEVSGSVANKTRSPGSPVTLVFTFYAESGAQLGTVNQTVTLGEANMSEVFQLQFDSAEFVGGYGYRVN